jgi:hypothetical protein
MSLSHDPANAPSALSLLEFLRQSGAGRLLAVRDGQLVCLEPESAEARALYQRVQAALAAGTITDLRALSGTGDG